MNPKVTITVDSKNRAVSSVTGMLTVGAKVDVEINGMPTDIPDWAATDKFTGKSLRFRIVDELGHDLVRYPLKEKTTTPQSDGDTWTVDANNKYTTTSGCYVECNTESLRKVFCGIPFNETLEFGVILDSIVDSAQYATGRIKVRQWSSASMEDPTVLPDWRATLVKLQNDLAAVEAAKTDAQTAATNANTAKNDAISAKGSAEGARDAALTYSNNASTYATNASNSATTANTKATEAAGSAASAASSMLNYPRIKADNKHWERYVSNAWEDTGVKAEGVDGTSSTISVGTVTTGEPGTSASVVNVGTSSAAVFNFTIPRGNTGQSGSSNWDDITGKPSTFPPSTHTHSDYAKMITTGSLSDDSSLDDVISKINTLISQLKG